MSKLRTSVSLLASSALIVGSLSGCSSTNLFGSNNLSVDPGDPCGSQRQHFAESQSFFTQEIVVRTATGALIGAGAGAAIGGATGGGRGAGIGALTGALVGGAAGFASGYWDKLQQQQLDQQQLAQTINSDLRTESANIDHTTAAFATLRSCRFAEAQHIKADARRGLISRSEAESRLSQERTRFNQEVQVAEQAGVNMQKRDDQFTYAADNLRQSRRPTRSASSISVAATETIPQKRNSFENTVKASEAQSSTAFSLDTSAAAPDDWHRYA